MELAYKTKGDSSPQGKAHVYFTSHPGDFDLYFEEICADILKYRDLDCAIYYKKDLAAEWTEEDMKFELNQMKLFVLPVTDRLLTDENNACDVEYKFALEHHIPVLFLLQEEGDAIKEKFEKKYGGVQYLDKFQDSDLTAIRYEKKMHEFLFSILLGNELAQKVRDAFDAYIFISYRKDDREYAQDFMRLIHRNDFCRDIAIWYDEFLVPGEEFNQAIKKAIEMSKLFTLVVTPTLFEPTDNYVIKSEYPDANILKKPIIAAEMESTDWDQLKKYFEDIPDPIDAQDENILTNVLREKLRDLALDENCNDPEHLYFIGLAYQNGIDVEVDPERAISILTTSAEGNVPEAMEKLSQIYELGDGVAKDGKKCVFWLEKLAAFLEKKARQNPSVDNLNELFKTERRLTLASAGVQSMAEACDKWIFVGEYLIANYGELQYREELSQAYSLRGSIFEDDDDFAGAKDCYLKKMHLWENFLRKTAREALKDLADNYYELAITDHEGEDFDNAKSWYMKSMEIHEKLCCENCTKEMKRTLADDYYGLALTSHEEPYFNNYENPKSWQMDEILCRAKSSVENQDVADAYQEYDIPGYRKENLIEAKKWCLKSLILREELYQEMGERPDVFNMKALADNYYEQGIIEYLMGSFAEAKESCLKSWKLYEEITALSDFYHNDLADICRALSIICHAMGDLDEEKKWREKKTEASER